jgi:Family of unknown function (DUF6527)
MSEANYNKQSVDCRLIGDVFPEPPIVLEAGQFCWGPEQNGERTLYIVLPSFDYPDALTVRRGAPGGNRVWGWDGNEEKPTLQPSIHVIGRWHGYLTAGRLQSC